MASPDTADRTADAAPEALTCDDCHRSRIVPGRATWTVQAVRKKTQ